MALETVVYAQEQFGYGCIKEFNASTCWGYNDLGLLQSEEENSLFLHCNNNWDSSSRNSMLHNQYVKECNNWDISNSSLDEGWINNVEENQVVFEGSDLATTRLGSKKKKRTSRSCKNKEEMESQRMTHIAVERNRRKQMNEYLNVLRSLMPPSYVQRADQASIIGGAINFVKELEQRLQTLEAQKRTCHHRQQQSENGKSSSSPLFADFFSFPQYSTTHSNHANSSLEAEENRLSAMADIEVTIVESYANLKILSKRRPKQLLKMVAWLQCMWLTVLHINVTTVDQMVLYSFGAKLEEGCQLTTVDEIAEAVNQLLARIQEEGTPN